MTSPCAVCGGHDLRGRYSPAVARGLVGVARRAGIAERTWAPDFRDRMAVVARRA